MNKSCHTYKRVVSHIYTSHVTHMNESCHPYKRVMPHTWMCHVTHMNEWWNTHEWVMRHESNIGAEGSCHKYMNEWWNTHEWVMKYTWMSHETWKQHRCRRVMSQIYEWVMKHTWISHDTRRQHKRRRVMSHIWMRDEIHGGHVTHMNEGWNTQGSCHTYEWAMKHTGVMSHIWMSDEIHMGHVTHLTPTYASFHWKCNILEIHQIEFLDLVDFEDVACCLDLVLSRFHWKCKHPRNPPNRETQISISQFGGFLGFSRYKFKLRFRLNVNFYRGSWSSKSTKSRNFDILVSRGTNLLRDCGWMWICTGWRRPIGCLKLRVIFRKRATNYRAL